MRLFCAALTSPTTEQPILTAQIRRLQVGQVRTGGFRASDRAKRTFVCLLVEPLKPTERLDGRSVASIFWRRFISIWLLFSSTILVGSTPAHQGIYIAEDRGGGARSAEQAAFNATTRDLR